MLISIVRDISQAKATQEKINNINKKYCDLVENSEDYIFSIDTEGRFTLVNTWLEKVYGLPRDQLIGKNSFELLSEEDRDRIFNLFKTAIEKNEPMPIIEGRIKIKDNLGKGNFFSD